jgi:threonine dehydratase
MHTYFNTQSINLPLTLGNHAQGVAISAQKLGIKAKIVMPVPTPAIKVSILVAKR